MDKQAPAPAPANKAVAAESKGFDHWNDTYYPKGVDTAAVNKDWYIIDAEGQTLGRLAVVVAHFVRWGLFSPTGPFSPLKPRLRHSSRCCSSQQGFVVIDEGSMSRLWRPPMSKFHTLAFAE